MSNPLKLDEVFRNLPRLIRYVLPGFLIVVLWEFSLPDSQGRSLPELGWSKLLGYAVVLGPTYYGLHRLLFWFVDDWMFSRWGTDCWGFFTKRYDPDDKELARIVAYMEYRWSTLHYCLMTSELGILFSFLCADTSLIGGVRWQVLSISGVLFAVSFWCFLRFDRIELSHLGFARDGGDPQKPKDSDADC